jgi:HAE1 family hydrophobic/amphiphilic exporter-1
MMLSSLNLLLNLSLLSIEMQSFLNHQAFIHKQVHSLVSSGQVIEAINAESVKLPEGYSFEWTALTFQDVETSGGMAILFTYLFLVAQYERWMIPFSILLAVPTALFGSMLFATVMGETLNIYIQIGLVLMIGMACRNAILIVEFVKVLREKRGLTILDAGIQAAKMRMRAVLMTAFSFILGVTPLVLATGAGSASRNSMGYAVFGGMITATIIGCIFVPVFFMMFQKLRERFGSKTEIAIKADAKINS